MAMNSEAGFGTVRFKRYLNLETYRRNGQAVRTPLWFALASSRGTAPAPKIYAYTTADSGKAKRIRRNGGARIAACTALGRVTGPWIDVRVAIVSGEEARRGMRLINLKYIPIKQILDLFWLVHRHERVVLAISPN
jgi:PPOX class probable F420-dependent enzyme